MFYLFYHGLEEKKSQVWKLQSQFVLQCPTASGHFLRHGSTQVGNYRYMRSFRMVCFSLVNIIQLPIDWWRSWFTFKKKKGNFQLYSLPDCLGIFFSFLCMWGVCTCTNLYIIKYVNILDHSNPSNQFYFFLNIQTYSRGGQPVACA